MTEQTTELWEKYEALKTTLASMESVLVAYSGGVDSAFLLKAASDALGDRTVGVFVSSPLMTTTELNDALTVAETLGARVVVLEASSHLSPEVLANTPDRCYFCKASICATLKAYAAEHGYRVVSDGSNVDDLGDYRPGQRAARECGMQSPLQIAGFTKAEIRALSRELGLPTWDKPSTACLASRIPYGTPITEEALRQIGEAEQILKDLGFGQLRVRHHDTVARIEVPVEDFERVLDHRFSLVTAFEALGYTYVTLDLSGFRSGSMNKVLDTHGR
ncbi:MAG: ATP-dependent sacrificial sulfur transferase LarE [Anaerolineae bacterium]|nr:ATP-dependent sacrificial sulfur transferase LarE [Anaerolineae bacterium]